MLPGEEIYFPRFKVQLSIRLGSLTDVPRVRALPSWCREHLLGLARHPARKLKYNISRQC